MIVSAVCWLPFCPELFVPSFESDNEGRNRLSWFIGRFPLFLPVVRLVRISCSSLQLILGILALADFRRLPRPTLRAIEKFPHGTTIAGQRHPTGPLKNALGERPFGSLGIGDARSARAVCGTMEKCGRQSSLPLTRVGNGIAVSVAWRFANGRRLQTFCISQLVLTSRYSFAL